MPTLDAIAGSFLERVYTPYSGRPAAAAALLSDGTIVPGVRVENASFSLVLEASVNALTTAVAAGRTDVVALRPDASEPSMEAYLADVFGGGWSPHANGLVVRSDAGELPAPGPELDPFLDLSGEAPMDAATRLAARAVVTQSAFPVSSVLETADGRGISGVNVETGRWGDILCAERNALGTWVSLGRPPVRALHLTCPKDDSGTPCGACRQWLVELMPDMPIVMDRGAGRSETVLPAAILPGAFTGRSLRDGSAR